MKRFIAVDSGKSNTKVAVYDEIAKKIKTSIFRTKYDTGTFEDTDPGSATFLVEFGNQTYKVGRNATKEAELTTSKMTFIHKLCTLFAIAKECSENEIDEVYAAIGIPVKDYQEVEIRNKYRDYILPNEEVTVRYKLTGDGEIITKKFKFAGRYVYPESIGAIFVPGVDPLGTIGVVDIGHLNVNMTMFNAGEADPETSVTTTKGANALVSGLAQKLSAAYSFINKPQTAELICRKGVNRCLKPIKPDKTIETESGIMVTKYITDYVSSIKDDCISAQWSVDYTQFVFIGGTTVMISNELKQIFGSEIIIPENGNMVNAIGFLTAMCARKDTLRIKIQ